MLKDELDLDGRPNLNLASFVGTYMEREAEQLMIENLSKNMSDADEYPAMMAMHARCVSIISHLYVYFPSLLYFEMPKLRLGSINSSRPCTCLINNSSAEIPSQLSYRDKIVFTLFEHKIRDFLLAYSEPLYLKSSLFSGRFYIQVSVCPRTLFNSYCAAQQNMILILKSFQMGCTERGDCNWKRDYWQQ